MGYAPNGGKKHPNPKLILSGKWLEALGFTTGQHVTVIPEQGQLIIYRPRGLRSLPAPATRLLPSVTGRRLSARG
ncbi:SymE family type I addiction module toxin [Yersinia sp. LJYL362]|uniref:SymE family type I addiction module toxin n=1 Tax=Yersinia sp. LJYL362 TaxID=3402108 RepID=UPI003AB50BD8